MEAEELEGLFLRGTYVEDLPYSKNKNKTSTHERLCAVTCYAFCDTVLENAGSQRPRMP